MPNSEGAGRIIAVVGAIFPIAAAIVGYVISLEIRFTKLDADIATLKSQVQVFGIAPSISADRKVSNSTGNSSTPSASPTNTDQENPLLRTCSDLALRAASAIQSGSPSTVAEPIKELMKQMGCIPTK